MITFTKYKILLGVSIMKKTKIMTIMLTLALGVSIFTGCGSTSSSSSSSADQKVTITLLNSKGEIETQLEDEAKAFTKVNPNITVQVMPVGSGTTFQKLSSMYAAGNAPTIQMNDPGDVAKFKDKYIDLSSQKWVNDADDGALDVTKIGGKMIGFPVCTEGYGLIYNKAVLDKAVGGSFDPTTIQTRSDLEGLFKKIQATGVDALDISPLDWSLGNHFLPISYSDQSNNFNDVATFIKNLQAGSVDLTSNVPFNGLMDTFDMMKNYNHDKKDPMAGTYDNATQFISKGTIGTWFMGDWAWPDLQKAGATGQFGFLPLPISNNASDYGNTQIPVGVTKFMSIDGSQNSKAQQAAAEKFLSWMVYSKTGQDYMVNKESMIPPFKNITITPQNPLAKSIQDYVKAGKTLEFMTTLPSDHYSVLGADMQKYLAGKEDRKTLETNIQNYWKTVK
jgi:raffinose/stachyose/melibiose transport system substrate-binding protein